MEGKDGFQVTKNTKCCSNHFRTEDITRVPGGTRWSLKNGAKPIKVFSTPPKKRKQPATRHPIDIKPKKLCDNITCVNNNEEFYQPKSLVNISIAAVHQAHLLIIEENKKLKAKVKSLEDNLKATESTLKNRTFGTHIIKDNNDLCRHYTSMPDYTRVSICLDYLDVGKNGENIIMKGASGSGNGRPRTIGVEDQFLMILLKLRRGFSNAHCGFLFNCSETTASRIINSWLNFMFLRFTVLPIWSSREEVDASMPASFKAAFPKTRAIVDCTEIFVESPESLYHRTLSYSDYKHHNTYKAFIAITPAGSLSYVSELFPGSVSDREIVERCGFLRPELWEKGDVVMGDKGFNIRDLLDPLGVTLNTPYFLEDKTQFSTQQVCYNQSISSLRIHVERYINRIKNFAIFDRPIPVTMHGSANQIFTVCSFLAMFQDPIISVK